MHYKLNDLSLTRVDYMTLPVPAELVGLSKALVKSVSWADAPWVENDQVVISAAAWFLEVDGKRVVLDPVQAVDALLRADSDSELLHQNEIGKKFAESGFDVASIDWVLMTHIEGVGMVARREKEQWAPYFPNAKILISDVQLEAFNKMEMDHDDPTHQCWLALIDQGAIETYADGEELWPGVVAEVTGYHCDGHSVFRFNGGELTFMGHLAVSPVHMATGPCEALNENADKSFEALHRVASDGRQMIGPLWPAPGIGRWTTNGFEGSLPAEGSLLAEGSS